MNKAKILGLSSLLAFSITACGTGNGTAQTTSPETQTQTAGEGNTAGSDSGTSAAEADGAESDAAESDPVNTANASDGSNILIAYFSRVGNTDFDEDVDASSSASIQLENGEIAGNMELVAGMIQENVGGDMFLIETADTYPADYDEVLDVAQAEGNEDARPELASHVTNMDGYDVVFLGYPNWWGDCPMAVFSFLEEYDFSGKTVIPFCTSGGSGLSGTVSTIRSMLPGATVLDGFATGDSGVIGAGTAVAEWVSGLDITQ